MIRTLSTAFALTMLLAGTALAQTSTPQTGTTPPAAGSGTGSTGGTTGAGMNCRDEIAKAEPMVNQATGEKKTTATRELGLAKENLAKNDERTCMTHLDNAKKAMN